MEQMILEGFSNFNDSVIMFYDLQHLQVGGYKITAIPFNTALSSSSTRRSLKVPSNRSIPFGKNSWQLTFDFNQQQVSARGDFGHALGTVGLGGAYRVHSSAGGKAMARRAAEGLETLQEGQMGTKT